MFTRAKQRCRNGKGRLAFERLDRHTGRDPAVQGNLVNIVRRDRLALGGHRLGSEIDDVGRRDRPAFPATLGHAHHFECARTVRQAADKPALFQSGNQPMHAGLRLEVKRLLHFLERRRNAGFGEPVMNEAEQFMLFAGQHRGASNRERTWNF